MEEQEFQPAEIPAAETELPVVAEQTTSVIEEDPAGIIQISDNVIRLIVRKYTLSVDGVVRFQNQSLRDGLFDILGKRSGEHGINVTINGDGTAEITVSVVLRFGVSIPVVGHAIQETLRNNIENMAGYTVKRVNVNVIDLEEVPEPEPVKEEQPQPVKEEEPEPVKEEQPDDDTQPDDETGTTEETDR